MKRLTAMLLAVVLVCLPFIGMAEAFVIPETLDGFIPNLMEILSLKPPVTAPSLVVSETGELFLYCETAEENSSKAFDVSTFIDGEFFELEMKEEHLYSVPNAEKVLADIELGIVPQFDFGYFEDACYYTWTYWMDSQVWLRSVTCFPSDSDNYYSINWVDSENINLHCPEHSDLKYRAEFNVADDVEYEAEYNSQFCLLPHND